MRSGAGRSGSYSGGHGRQRADLRRPQHPRRAVLPPRQRVRPRRRSSRRGLGTRNGRRGTSFCARRRSTRAGYEQRGGESQDRSDLQARIICQSWSARLRFGEQRVPGVPDPEFHRPPLDVRRVETVGAGQENPEHIPSLPVRVGSGSPFELCEDEVLGGGDEARRQEIGAFPTGSSSTENGRSFRITKSTFCTRANRVELRPFRERPARHAGVDIGTRSVRARRRGSRGRPAKGRSRRRDRASRAVRRGMSWRGSPSACTGSPARSRCAMTTASRSAKVTGQEHGRRPGRGRRGPGQDELASAGQPASAMRQDDGYGCRPRRANGRRCSSRRRCEVAQRTGSPARPRAAVSCSLRGVERRNHGSTLPRTERAEAVLELATSSRGREGLYLVRNHCPGGMRC